MNASVLKTNFENHEFHTSFFQTKEEAVSYLKGKIQGTTVGIGGSMTVEEMGLYEVLKENNTVYWHWKQDAPDTRLKARDAEVYLLSANAAAETGELVNIDGSGNRLSASVFGPKKVYYVIGKNKITPDLASAVQRAKEVAAVKNAKRFQAEPESICRAMLILSRPCNGMEVELLFIEEELGY